jgi:hypothetical protein
MGQTCRQQSGRRENTHSCRGAANYVHAYDFSSFGYSTVDEILDAHRRTAYWASRFGGHLPPPPLGQTPNAIAQKESRYVGKLLEVYAETTGASICRRILPGRTTFKNSECASMNAEAFMVHYRDQTEPGTIEDLQSRFSMPSSLRFQFPNRRMGG